MKSKKRAEKAAATVSARLKKLPLRSRKFNPPEEFKPYWDRRMWDAGGKYWMMIYVSADTFSVYVNEMPEYEHKNVFFVELAHEGINVGIRINEVIQNINKLFSTTFKFV